MRFPRLGIKRSPLTVTVPAQVVVFCLEHRRRRLTHPRSPDTGCGQCSGHCCRFCGRPRQRAVGVRELEPGVCARAACRRRATVERRNAERESARVLRIV